MKYFKRWFKAAVVRALKTFAQAAIAVIGTEQLSIGQIDWKMVVSTAAVAAILSMLTSVAGLPEVEYTGADLDEEDLDSDE